MKTDLFPVLTAGGAADWVFGSILSALSIALIVLLVLYFRKNKARKAPVPAPTPRPAAPAAGDGLIGSLAPGTEPAPEKPPAGASARDDKTMDKRYADRHGQWVCRFCETINDEGLGICQACGQPRI